MGLLDLIFGKKKPKSQISKPIKRQNTAEAKITTEYIRIDNPSVVKELMEKYIAFDTETTGLNSYSDRIIELGAVVFEGGIPTKRFSTLIQTGKHIPTAATEVNHITDAMCENAPKEHQVYPEFISFLGDAMQGKTLICAHNAFFDMGFLSKTLERMGYSGNIRYVDTMNTAKSRLSLANYKQDTVAQAFGLKNENAHRAESDAEICGKILWELLKVSPRKRTQEAQQDDGYAPYHRTYSLPLIARAEVDDVPEPPLTDEEKEICAIIQRLIRVQGGSTEKLTFHKTKRKHIYAFNLFPMVIFKQTRKDYYIIVPRNITIPEGFSLEDCPAGEYPDMQRARFTSTTDIGFLKDYILSQYKSSCEESEKYLCSEKNRQIVDTCHVVGITMTDEEEDSLIIQAYTKEALRSEEKIKSEEKKKTANRTEPKPKKAPAKPKRIVIQMDDNGNVLNEYDTASAAATAVGVNPKCISDAARGVQKHAAGYVWMYKEIPIQESQAK